MNNNSNNCGDCGTTCSECGRPWAICKQDGGCGCNKCKDIKFCEYGRMANGCVREKQPGCPMQAVIPSVTIESIEGIKNLADCLVHVSDINTTFYIDDKHRPIITWAGPIDIPGYDMEGNPNNYRDQIVTDVANQMAVIYDKSGNGYLFGLAENIDLQEQVNNKLDAMAESGELSQILSGMSYYVNPKVFGAVGDGTTDDTQALQDCIDYANTNQLAVELDRKRYKITDSLTIYTNLHIYGNGSEIVLDADKAIFTSEDILHHVMIEDVRLTGANDSTKTSNNGIELVCYYSTFKGIEFKNLYNAIRLIVGSATGTLVENRIENCNVRDCQQGFYIGALNNNKLTDGFIKNCVVKTVNDTLYGIYIGSGAGWIIDGVHVYGTNKYGLRVANSFNTNISNIYVESRSEISINLDTMQTTTSLDNVSIVLSKPDGIGISQSAAGYIAYGYPWLNVSNCLINAWESVTSAIGIRGSNVQLTNSIIYSASENGFTPTNVTNLRNVANANVEGKLSNKNDRLRYQDQGLGLCIKHFVDSGTVENTIRVKVPETMIQYDMYIFNFRLLGYENWNGTKNFDYASEIVLINKNNVASVKNITTSSTTNFSVAPAATYDSSTNELVIKFTPSVHLYGTYMITG